MNQLADTPVFDESERKNFEHNQTLAPFTAITKNHLVGLFRALGEFAYRVEPIIMPKLFDQEVDPEWMEAVSILFSYFWRRHPCGDAVPPGEPYFTPAEREFLRHHKYVRGEDFSKSEIIGLLKALGQFALKAKFIQQAFGRDGLARSIHAHNALISFRERPFTEEEFSASVRAVGEGQKSLVTE